MAVPAGLWFAWPRRKLEASVRQLAADELVLDFNDRTHERTVLAATVQLRNLRRNPTYTAGFKRIAAGLRALPPSPIANADTKALMLAESAREAAPFGLGGPHQYRHEERRPASGRELPVFFDPTEIRDLDQIAGAADAVFELPAEIDLDAHRAGKETLPLGCRVKILPETGRLEETCKGIELDADGHRRCRIEYKAGQHQEPLCTYRLENSAKHRYSRPVKGELEVLVHDLSSRPLAGAVRLLAADQDQPLDRVDFYLRYQDPQDIQVVVDFTQLANPIDQDAYRVSILKRKVDDSAEPEGENQDQGTTNDRAPGPWETLDEWNLIVERSTERTEVSLLILENERHHSVRLNAARSRLDTPFPIGTESHPRPIMPQAQSALNQARLFTVRLANACRNGHGHADWRARIEVEGRRGLQFPTEALRLVDRRGQSLANGTLWDSPDSAARELDLDVILDLDQADFTQRDAVLEIGVTVIWTLYKKELGHPDASERIENSARVICYLRHQPPRDVLAIDFGTSALAIAHAAGPSGIELLPLPRRLTEIEAETKFRRRDDLSGRDSHFLASELNVCIDPEQLARTRPDDPDFLDLPLREIAVYEYPDKCFSSLKALIAAGYLELPLDTRQYPYLNQQGESENRRSPPLDQVIAGAYKGLVRDFIQPILDQSNQGYSHIYVTHPNSYTQNHVRRLQNLVEQVFSGIARDENLVYPDNIHFVSESDAVAYYYLVYAHKLRTPGTVVPDRERILVYDIGAGTLDFTYLEVDWQTTNAGDYTPKQIRVRRRGGVTKAGDLLDECIARDLHAYLTAELDAERYLTPIVVTTAGESMDEAEMRRMDELRQQIHRLKIQLSQGEANPSLELSTTGQATARLVATQGEDTPGLYEGCSELRATQAGQVFWEPGRERILNGDCVRAFIDRGTRVEVERFFGGRIPGLDTLILSGRTSLWPGFGERLRTTLGTIANWVDFNSDADQLKQAVVLGVIEREFRWRNIQIETPQTIGDFGVCYEPRAGDWKFAPYARSGERKSFDLQNAGEVQIGLRTNNGFHLCYSLLPDLYYAEDTKPTIQLDYDETGYLEAEVTNSDGSSTRINQLTNIPTLAYERRPWPLGTARLHEMTPEGLLGDAGETI